MHERFLLLDCLFLFLLFFLHLFFRHREELARDELRDAEFKEAPLSRFAVLSMRAVVGGGLLLLNWKWRVWGWFSDSSR